MKYIVEILIILMMVYAIHTFNQPRLMTCTELNGIQTCVVTNYLGK